MSKVVVHVRCNKAGAVRREKLNGRDVIIVPSATLPDDIVMNAIRYPAEEIEKSFMGLERTPAPLGHPSINGKFVSATDPEGINIGWVGAFNTNVRREKGKDGKHRVLLDKVIDVEVAQSSERGQRLLNAIEKGEPISTSTGLLCELEAANGDVNYKHIARNMVWDHDALLLDEEGAATPAQGVGVFVNSANDGGEEITVVNSALDMADGDLDWALDSAFRALEKRNRAPLLERMKAAIIEAFGSEREPSEQQNKDADMTVSKEQFDALSAKVDTLSESIGKTIEEAVTKAVAAAVKPLTDANEALVNAQKAKDEAELAGLRATIVKANLLDEEGAGELTLNAARKLAEKVAPKGAAALNAAFNPAGDKPGFTLPDAEA
jgi:hypothetical protein